MERSGKYVPDEREENHYESDLRHQVCIIKVFLSANISMSFFIYLIFFCAYFITIIFFLA